MYKTRRVTLFPSIRIIRRLRLYDTFADNQIPIIPNRHKRKKSSNMRKIELP